MNESPLLEIQLRALRLSAILTNYRTRLSEHSEPLPYLSDLVALETTNAKRTVRVRESPPRTFRRSRHWSPSTSHSNLSCPKPSCSSTSMARSLTLIVSQDVVYESRLLSDG